VFPNNIVSNFKVNILIGTNTSLIYILHYGVAPKS